MESAYGTKRFEVESEPTNWPKKVASKASVVRSMNKLKNRTDIAKSSYGNVPRAIKKVKKHG